MISKDEMKRIATEMSGQIRFNSGLVSDADLLCGQLAQVVARVVNECAAVAQTHPDAIENGVGEKIAAAIRARAPK